MVVENNEGSLILEKIHYINQLKAIKSEALKIGIDWPTQNPSEATREELRDFLKEVTEAITESKND
jgi:hypothetical protein